MDLRTDGPRRSRPDLSCSRGRAGRPEPRQLGEKGSADLGRPQRPAPADAAPFEVRQPCAGVAAATVSVHRDVRQPPPRLPGAYVTQPQPCSAASALGDRGGGVDRVLAGCAAACHAAAAALGNRDGGRSVGPDTYGPLRHQLTQRTGRSEEEVAASHPVTPTDKRPGDDHRPRMPATVRRPWTPTAGDLQP